MAAPCLEYGVDCALDVAQSWRDVTGAEASGNSWRPDVRLTACSQAQPGGPRLFRLCRGQGVEEGCFRLGVPGALPCRQGGTIERIGQERNETEEAEEAGHRALDGVLTPVSMGRDAEVPTGLLEPIPFS